MHLIISVLNIKSSKIREFICGKPTILIYQGRIDEQKMKKERFTLDELEEKLRSNNVMDIGDVEFWNGENIPMYEITMFEVEE